MLSICSSTWTISLPLLPLFLVTVVCDSRQPVLTGAPLIPSHCMWKGCSTIWDVVLPPVSKARIVLGPLLQNHLTAGSVGPTCWIRLWITIQYNTAQTSGDAWSGGIWRPAFLMCSRWWSSTLKFWNTCFNLFLSLPSLPGSPLRPLPWEVLWYPVCSLPLFLSVWVKVALGSAGSALSHWTGGLLGTDAWPSLSSCHPGSSRM